MSHDLFGDMACDLLLIALPYPAWMMLALPHFGFLFVTWWGLMRNYQLSMTLLADFLTSD
jgi:hypothetical protein